MKLNKMLLISMLAAMGLASPLKRRDPLADSNYGPRIEAPGQKRTLHPEEEAYDGTRTGRAVVVEKRTLDPDEDSYEGASTGRTAVAEKRTLDPDEDSYEGASTGRTAVVEKRDVGVPEEGARQPAGRRDEAAKARRRLSM